MSTIYKYPAPIQPGVRIVTPGKAKFLTVQVQNGSPFVWMLVELGQRDYTHQFYWRSTGHSGIEELGPYLGAVQIPPRVWHFFGDAQQ